MCNTINKVTVLLLFLAAAGLRLPLLDRRPMHADEAILADKFSTLLTTGSYPYDPSEYHGPMLGYLAWAPAHVTGRTTYAALTESTLRAAPAVTGILLALSPLLLAPAIGATAAISASALVAVSPMMVYYSRYFIPETPLGLWTAALLIAIVRRSWFLAGVAAALMIATKETAVLALAAGAIAYFAAYRPHHVNWRSIAIFSTALVVGVSVFLAAPWKWGVLAQSAAAYFERAGAVHRHPWYSYLQWLSITEGPILILAVVGRTDIRACVPRFLAIYTILLLTIYSAIPYKTPWCAVSLLYCFALLAGMTIASLPTRWRILPAVAAVFLACAAWAASVPYATDPRNPWVYAHTGPGVFTIRDRIQEFARAAPETPIDIYTRENLWPLPWYLRRFPNVRWWREVVITGPAAPIVLVSPALEPDLVRKLYEGPPPGERELYMNMFDGYVELRPQIEVRGYVAKSLWDRAQQ